MKTGIFVGSFDPFTIGHLSIVRRALPLFDKLVIGVGVNERKTYLHTTEERIEAISRLFADEPAVEVRSYSGLTVDFAHSVEAGFIVKGVRSMKDFEYEREQADINREIGGVETVLLFAEPQLAHISSSMVRELTHFGKDPAPYLP
jgi:pantetheine-phosphate adenylyltransferase